MAVKTDDNLLVWLPADCDGHLLSDMLAVLNQHGYSTRVQMAAYARGQKMRINADKRPPLPPLAVARAGWETDNGG